MIENELPAYVSATPGRVMSTLAYVMLSQAHWPVYVKTDRNYTAYRNGYDTPTDPGETIHGSAHLHPVDTYHPFGQKRVDGWERAAHYLDDRIRPESETDYAFGKCSVTGPWDEYFIVVGGPNGSNIASYSDYSGSTYTASNYRSLLRDYPDTFVEVSYGHGGHELAIPLFVPTDHRTFVMHQFDTPHYDRDRAEGLAGVLLGLAEDYPVYDEEDMTRYEDELIEEVQADDWWQREIRGHIATALATRIMGKMYPLNAPALGPCDDDTSETGGCVAYLRKNNGCEYSSDPLSRGRFHGVDTYRLTETLEEWLEGTSTFRDPYQNEDSPGYHTIYSLLVQFLQEQGRIEFETADVSGVVFRDSQEAYEDVADYILGDVPANTPLLSDEDA